jgi:hypothetical protein
MRSKPQHKWHCGTCADVVKLKLGTAASARRDKDNSYFSEAAKELHERKNNEEFT